MKEALTRSVIIVAASILLIFGVSSVLISNTQLAANTGESNQPNDVPPNPMPRKSQASLTDAEKQKLTAEKKERLDGAKLKLCQAREKRILHLRGNLSNYGQKHFTILNKISERVQTFYKDKSLNISNYDALVADVNSKKAAVSAAVEALKASRPGFSCDGTGPKANAEAFKQNHRKVVAAMKDYKTSVKNLVKAVKEAARAAEQQ